MRFIIFIFLTIPLLAIDFRLKLSKDEAFVNEPIVAKFILEYNKSDLVQKIEFEDFELKNFWIKKIEQLDSNKSNRFKKEYIFLFTPQKSANLTIKVLPIKLLIKDKKLGLKEWKHYYSNFKTIKVNKAPKDIVGSLTLKSKLKNEKNNIYNYKIVLKGLANFENIKPFKLNIDSYYYSSNPIIKYNYENGKVNGEYIQNFKIILNKSLSIKPIKFTYFNVNTKIIENLETKSYKLKYKKAFDYFYIIYFLAGAIFTLIAFLYMSQKNRSKKIDLIKEIKDAKSDKELYKTLLKFSNRYYLKNELKLLEENIYLNKKNRIDKKEIIKKLKF